MDIVFERLKMTRKLMSITQEEAARGAGLLQRDISRIENGKVQFIPTPYLKFLHRSGVDINWIYDPEMNEAQAFRRGKRFNQSTPSGAFADSALGSLTPDVEISEDLTDKLVIVPVVSLQDKDGAGQYSVVDFSVVDTISLPGHYLPKGKIYAKEVAGDAMAPKFASTDVVVGRKLDRLTLAHFEVGASYFYLTGEQGVLVRKLKAIEGSGDSAKLVMMAENSQYPDISMSLSDLSFCAQIFLKVSKSFS